MITSASRLVALLFLISPLTLQAAKPDPSEGDSWPSDATLTVNADHVFEWPTYTGFRVQNYDIYYDASDQAPGYDPTRLKTGVISPWTDSLPGIASRCNAEKYWIRAYDRGRKTYSPILRAERDYLCGSSDPVADAGPDQTVGIDEVVTMDGSGSFDIDGTIDSYVWTLPDGSTLAGRTASVSFESELTHTITLTVIDNDNNESTDSLDVIVSNEPPPDDLFSDEQGDTPVCEPFQTKMVRGDNPPYFPEGYTTLYFSEEFDSALDPTVWNSRYEWDAIINSEAQYYVDALGDDAAASNWSPFTISDDGRLSITANTTEDAGLGWLTTQPYVSGVLNTQHKVSFNGSENGGLFFEAYARPARGNGMWSAFWLYHKEYTNPDPEIDIFEYLGQSLDNDGNWLQATNKDGNPVTEPNYNTWDTQYHTYYPGAGGPKGRKVSNYTNQKIADAPAWCGPQEPGIDFSQAFHKYSLEWTSEYIRWYIDDILLHEVTSSERKIANEPMYIILNLAIGSEGSQDESWPGAPDTYTENLIATGNARMVVDWVRVYAR